MTLREIWGSVMTPADKLLFFVLLFLSITSYAIIRTWLPYGSESTALVEINGSEVMRISLSPDLPYRRIPVKLERGTAYLEVSNGQVRILPMDGELCPRQICSKTGWVGRPWEMIVCMPNKIMVRVVGEKKAGEVDYITK